MESSTTKRSRRFCVQNTVTSVRFYVYLATPDLPQRCNRIFDLIVPNATGIFLSFQNKDH
jgi:hypothetical protein